MLSFLKRDIILWFWLPRLAVCALLFSNFDSAHLTLDPFRERYVDVTSIPDKLKYLNGFNFNPLFSITLQLIHGLPLLGPLFKLLLAQLISGLSCITLFFVCNRYFKLNYFSLVLLAIHPMLATYSLKFCTENFSLLAVAVFFVTRQKLNPYNYAKSLLSRLRNLFLQLILVCFRAQNLPLFGIELYEFIRLYINKNNIPSRRNYLIRIFIILLTASLIISGLYTLIHDYLVIIPRYMWGGPYSFRPKNLYEGFSSLSSSDSLLINLLTIIVSYSAYLLLSLFFVAGARERLFSASWQVNIGDISITNLTPGTASMLEDFSQSSYQSEFILKVLLPLLFFAILHILGLFFWVKSTYSIRPDLSLLPISIIIIPILFNPLLRYFLPLIPLACFGISKALESFISRYKSI